MAIAPDGRAFLICDVKRPCVGTWTPDQRPRIRRVETGNMGTPRKTHCRQANRSLRQNGIS